MCVTNSARRGPRSLATANPNSMISKTPSLLSQRLQSNFMPLMMSSSAGDARSAMPMSMPQSVQDSPFMGAKQDATKPRRRRKPQKPGKTAKLNDRHFVVHNYHDHANDVPENDLQDVPSSKRRGGVSMSFPIKLHAILDQVEEDGLSHVISWQPHGRCFLIHKPKEFTDYVMPKYFRQTKLTSFQRQLNLYGFSRLTIGKDNGGYYHELFLRGKVFLAKTMCRTKIKGTKYKAASSPDNEPDFYTMNPVTHTPPTSDESSVEDGSYQSPKQMRSLPQTSSMPPAALRLNFPVMSSIQTPSLPSLSVSAVDQFAYQMPQQQQMQPTPLMGAGFMTDFQAPKAPASDDNAFDAAIDEIFLENGNAMDDFRNIFDPNMQIPEKIEDDEQLGNILEQLLTQV
ncbi:unnamed protein product [Cylindrotheca closterium]|uniref:HSF-type DNA-binding domain-containing protein n=1 Tax=Cylindrotheca closterium TaxID=2856 RepID=A0AAD2CMF0_9STRA|nr:unnamed protein product [Cylindrotheca closterium]